MECARVTHLPCSDVSLLGPGYYYYGGKGPFIPIEEVDYTSLPKDHFYNADSQLLRAREKAVKEQKFRAVENKLCGTKKRTNNKEDYVKHFSRRYSTNSDDHEDPVTNLLRSLSLGAFFIAATSLVDKDFEGVVSDLSRIVRCCKESAKVEKTKEGLNSRIVRGSIFAHEITATNPGHQYYKDWAHHNSDISTEEDSNIPHKRSANKDTNVAHKRSKISTIALNGALDPQQKDIPSSNATATYPNESPITNSKEQKISSLEETSFILPLHTIPTELQGTADYASPYTKKHRFLTIDPKEYISFVCVRRAAVDNLSPRIVSAIKNSLRWKTEENLGLTNCIGLLVPKAVGPDRFLVLNIGFDDSFKACKSWVP